MSPNNYKDFIKAGDLSLVISAQDKSLSRKNLKLKNPFILQIRCTFSISLANWHY